MSVNVLLHFVLLLLPLLLILTEVEGAKKSYGVLKKKSVKLFVFGDSYADTGNFLNSTSYITPYGTTFPGKPDGRFSDGFVLTDYVASFLKIKTPAAYRLRNSSDLQYGMNFAYGGTGVLETLVDGTPNMTQQIDSLEKLIKQNVYTKADLQSSVALLSVAGNDYAKFVGQNRTIDITPFIKDLIKQLSINLQRIHKLGINKVAVGLLQPIGCLPTATLIISHLKCVDIFNIIPITHNELLLKTVQELNQQAAKTVFVTLDIYGAFNSIIENMEKQHFENSSLTNPLRPCCDGVDPIIHLCGDVDAATGEKKYSLCDKPELSFFWDHVHPSQNGWKAISTLLQSSLSQLVEKNN